MATSKSFPINMSEILKTGFFGKIYLDATRICFEDLDLHTTDVQKIQKDISRVAIILKISKY